MQAACVENKKEKKDRGDYMIIWKGYGFAVVLFAILGLIIGGILSDMLGTSGSWPFALGLFVGAGTNHFVAT